MKEITAAEARNLSAQFKHEPKEKKPLAIVTTFTKASDHIKLMWIYSQIRKTAKTTDMQSLYVGFKLSKGIISKLESQGFICDAWNNNTTYRIVWYTDK